MTPDKLGRYDILGELGKGAMGVVYLAQDPIIKRQLAIKTFRMAYSAKEKEVEQFRERFLREAQAVGQLNHPNIVTVHDVGQEDEEYFIAMEYVKGVDLKQRMQRQEGPIPVDFVVDVAAQIAEGLASAHEKGIVHRDVKPANIILTSEHQVKITDFGIARIEQSNLTVAGQLLGTPNYMAPEQIQGKPVDQRTDIFSLGVLIYEMLTRRKPFQGENLTQVTHRIVYDEFTSPSEFVNDLPQALLTVLDRALEKDPDRRYQDVAEMAADLRGILAPEEPLTGQVPIVTPEGAVSTDTAASTDALLAPPPAAPTPSPAAPTPSPAAPPSSAEFLVVEPQVVEPPSPPARSPPPPSPEAPIIAATAPSVEPPAPTPAPPAPSPKPSAPSEAPAPAVSSAPDSSPPAPKAPATVASKKPAAVASKKPGAVASKKPGAVASKKPGAVASKKPVAKSPRKRGAAKTPPKVQAKPLPDTAETKSSAPGPRRWILGAVAALVLGLAAVLIGSLSGGGEDPDVEAPQRSQLEIFREREADFLRRARDFSTAGAHEQALRVLGEGAAELPLSLQLTYAYFETAEIVDLGVDITDIYVEERMAVADAFISAKQYEQAYDLLERVLLVDADHEKAQQKTEDIQRFLSQRRQDEIKAANRTRPVTRRPTTTAPPPSAPAPPPPPTEGEVRIAFRTLIAEGLVTISGPAGILLQEPFSFDNRKTFKRKYLKSERGFDRPLTLPTGPTALQVEVEVELKDGRRTLTAPQVTGNVDGNRPRSLIINVGEDDRIDVQLH